MSDKHMIGALLYASVPFLLGVYLLLIDAGVFKDKSGHDEFYETIKEHRVATVVAAVVLILFAIYEFSRFLGAFRP